MDKYVRIKKIGEGSFGTAVLVRSKENGKQMVVKEIQMGKMSSKEREEARKEVAVLAQLNHSNVVSYRESFEEMSKLFIVMDYCDGGDLYSRINAQRGVLFTEEQVLDWFVQTTLALKHIHDRKILHRDIKSQNIFLTRKGIVKLGDFGIAKVLNSTCDLAKTCIGTPYYLSPEICENRPYNNKSDIWSLGCVLYELATLKHAFEAGNMKNLVLKIIRGSYPPVAPKYSYEMRNLISSLFKRNPRDRPSVTAILKKPFIQKRIQKFLSEAEIAEEFSHTVMHGVKIQKQLPRDGGRPLPPRPLPRPKSAATPSPYKPSTPKYNPASVYGQPVRKSREKPKVQVKRSADFKKPERRSDDLALARAELQRKKDELVRKENERRLLQKKKDSSYEKRHRDLIEKQRVGRINKAREEGWRGLMNSMSSGDSDNVTPAPVPAATPANRGVGDYKEHHAFLSELEERRKAALRQASPDYYPSGVRRSCDAAPTGARQAAAYAEMAAAKGAMAAGNAKVQAEYMNRKKEAALNKARDRGDIFGGVAAAVSPRISVPQPKPISRPDRVAIPVRKNEEDYLAKLRQIRLQNFNERRMLKDKLAGKADGKYKPKSYEEQLKMDERKRKIEALRAQADQQAQKVKAELEKKRQEALEVEKKGQNRPAPRPEVIPKQVPGIPLTQAMNAIGISANQPPPASPEAKNNIGMTAAMQAIGVSTSLDSAGDKSLIKVKKDAILKRLNAKLEKPVEEETSQESSDAAADRPKWNNAAPPVIDLSKMTLEQSASQMEATHIAEVVSSAKEEEKRRQWGAPRGTIVSALKEAGLAGTTAESLSPTVTPDSDTIQGLVGNVLESPTEEQGAEKEDESRKKWTDATKAGALKDMEIEDLEVEEETEETVSREKENQDDPEEKENRTGVVAGLTTGNFDIGDVKLLRTCSEPDLSKLFRTNIMDNPFFKEERAVAHSVSLMECPDDEEEEVDEESKEDRDISQLEEDTSPVEEDEDSDKTKESASETKSEKEDEEELEEEDEIGSGEDEMETLRASYMMVLEKADEEVVSEEETPVTKKKVKKVKKKVVGKKKKSKEGKEKAGSAPHAKDSSEEDFETMKQTMRDILTDISKSAATDKETKGKTEEKPEQEGEDVAFSIVPGKEAWQSDGDETEDYFEDAEEDQRFSRLEESRAKLEEELGCEVFLKAYKSIQAIHEDEDENIDDGIKIVTELLGEKKHLYDTILQFVMADCVFAEDNE